MWLKKVFITVVFDKLSDGIVYELKEENLEKYKVLLGNMNNCGTTQGRPD